MNLVKNQKITPVLGAIIGDVIGSVYEWNNVKTIDFPLFQEDTTFTDDSVLTCATMDALMKKRDYISAYQSWSHRYPNRGYGRRFLSWIYAEEPKPYNSWGNGSAMRVSPVGWAFNTLEEVLGEAKKSASVTHNHPEGIKGAQATAAAVFLAKQGKSKREIKEYITKTFHYHLDEAIDMIRPFYEFDESCQGTVPQAMIAFLESRDFEHAIRLAISLGGDSDTLACITGGIAGAFYKYIPDDIIINTLECLTDDMIEVILQFSKRYAVD